MQGFQSILFNPPDDNQPLSVSALTAHVKDLIEGDDMLTDVRVQGEVSNLSRPASGHWYFTLKDAGSQLKCAMWKSQAVRVRQAVQNGDQVVVRGRIGVYERDGLYQMYADALLPVGAGDLYAELECLKQKLSDEGLFDAARKRPLPALPKVLGVVTSPSTAAFQDILNVLQRRYPLIEVVLAPAAVQGADAPAQIVNAIEALNQLSAMPDVILIARGGGSAEDLGAFNDERVVRAIAGSVIPTITGVGHEIDFSLADFAADVRAPTPSAAAEMLTPDIAELRLNVDGLSQTLFALMQTRVSDARAELSTLQRALRLLNPSSQITQSQTRLNNLRARLRSVLLSRMALERAQLFGIGARLETVSPLATLQRGYAIVTRQADGVVVRRANEANAGDALLVRVHDGEFGVTKT